MQNCSSLRLQLRQQSQHAPRLRCHRRPPFTACAAQPSRRQALGLAALLAASQGLLTCPAGAAEGICIRAERDSAALELRAGTGLSLGAEQIYFPAWLFGEWDVTARSGSGTAAGRSSALQPQWAVSSMQVTAGLWFSHLLCASLHSICNNLKTSAEPCPCHVLHAARNTS